MQTQKLDSSGVAWGGSCKESVAKVLSYRIVGGDRLFLSFRDVNWQNVAAGHLLITITHTSVSLTCFIIVTSHLQFGG